MKPTRGMTLLEIMTVVALVGLMAGLAIAGIQGPLERQREREATRELWSATLRARQRAVATNQPVRIVVEDDVLQPDGTLRTVARWERLKCDNVWDNNTCPQAACEAATCRTNADCCDEHGEDIVLPRTMQAEEVDGLCFLPGSGRAVQPGNRGCMRGQLDNVAEINSKSAAASTLPINFTSTSGRARTLLTTEPLTGLTDVLDCDSKLAERRSLPACTAP